MPKLTSLKLTPKEGEDDCAICPPEKRGFPFGSEVSFEGDTYKKIPGIDEMQPDELIRVVGLARVTNKGIEPSIRLQFEQIAVSKDDESEKDDAFNKATS